MSNYGEDYIWEDFFHRLDETEIVMYQGQEWYVTYIYNLPDGRGKQFELMSCKDSRKVCLAWEKDIHKTIDLE